MKRKTSKTCKHLEEIFSGPESTEMWHRINDADTVEKLRSALYALCCRIQELERNVRNAR